ncbi:unnamed protein product [Notodromas monacha]|uniref:Peptidase C2 calpain domain-containing protein n=1 Tax=Notodromas monacha TaxID=399045 RepID=A0A7R9GD11_9CRUS|nr:unnamed protein product [Notodromas monacha]CAG0916428.1 unnamed protein product [Notodromas monacha]
MALPKRGEVIVQLMQRGHTHSDAMGRELLHVVGFAVTKVEMNRQFRLHKVFNAVVSSPFAEVYHVSQKFLLLPGRYLIVPGTCNPGLEADFMLRVFSKDGVKLSMLTLDHPQRAGIMRIFGTQSSRFLTRVQVKRVICSDESEIGFWTGRITVGVMCEGKSCRSWAAKMPQDAANNPQLFWNLVGFDSVEMNRQFRLHKVFNAVVSSPFAEVYHVSQKFVLLPGRYLIVPGTCNPGLEADFMLRVFSKDGVKLRCRITVGVMCEGKSCRSWAAKMPQDAANNPQLFWNLVGFDSVFYRKSLTSKILLEVHKKGLLVPVLLGRCEITASDVTQTHEAGEERIFNLTNTRRFRDIRDEDFHFLPDTLEVERRLSVYSICVSLKTVANFKDL